MDPEIVITALKSCCNNKCLQLADNDGYLDLRRVTTILKYCKREIEEIEETRADQISWWVQKLSRCFVKVGATGRMVFKFFIGSSIDVEEDLRIENVCRIAFTSAYEITVDQLQTFQNEFKLRYNLADSSSDQGDDCAPKVPKTGLCCRTSGALTKNGKIRPASNIYVARQICEQNGDINPGLDVLQALVVPDTPAACRCWDWMKEYFALTGEQMPNSAGEVHLDDTYTKHSVYLQYAFDIDEEVADGIELRDYQDEREENWGNPRLKLCPQRFFDLWDALYPFVKIRKFKLVSGHCDVCAMLSYYRTNAPEKKKVRKRLDDLTLLHRSFYMQERQLYYERRRLAQNHPEQYMSFITDGMAQVHCELPWQANLQAFTDKLTQHFQGVLEHGQKISIFRTFENVGTGSNLMIHCILRIMEDRLERDGRLPDTVFIQIDGGGENVARVVLAMCELIVSRGLTKKIIVSRLPVGHTHEDIDAIFAHIWKKVQSKHCLTPDSYKRLVAAALHTKGRAEKAPPAVLDLLVIPDYVRYLTPALDSKFSKYCKKKYTQHQFWFETAEEGICDKYPFGVKVRYRKYAQPEAIEIRKDSNSTDPVPLSAHIVESVWHYEEDQSGISMFAGNGPAMLRASEIRPAPFNVGSAAKYNKVLRSVKEKLDQSCHAEWDDFTEAIPKSDDSNEYVNEYCGGQLYVPLQHELFYGIIPNTTGAIPPHVPRPRGNGKETLPRERASASIETRDRPGPPAERKSRISRERKPRAPRNQPGDRKQNKREIWPNLQSNEATSSRAQEPAEGKVNQTDDKADHLEVTSGDAGHVIVEQSLPDPKEMCSRMNNDLDSDDDDNLDYDWDGKQTVTWNEETMETGYQPKNTQEDDIDDIESQAQDNALCGNSEAPSDYRTILPTISVRSAKRKAKKITPTTVKASSSTQKRSKQTNSNLPAHDSVASQNFADSVEYPTTLANNATSSALCNSNIPTVVAATVGAAKRSHNDIVSRPVRAAKEAAVKKIQLENIKKKPGLKEEITHYKLCPLELIDVDLKVWYPKSKSHAKGAEGDPANGEYHSGRVNGYNQRKRLWEVIFQDSVTGSLSAAWLPLEQVLKSRITEDMSCSESDPLDEITWGDGGESDKQSDGDDQDEDSSSSVRDDS